MNSPTLSISSTHQDQTNDDDIKASFDATAQARAAMFPEKLLPVNLEVPVALATISSTFTRLPILREEIAGLPNFDYAEFDRIKTYAEALLYAHTEYLAVTTPTAAIPAMAARATAFRDQFILDIKTLAGRGSINGERLSELKGGTGYLAIATDLGVLVSILRDRWDDIKSKSDVKAEELAEAQRLYPRIVFALGGRDQTSTERASAADDRQRAFTLLVNAYDQARRAVTYAHWDKDDADKILPSLWTQKGAGRPVSKPDTTTDTPAPAPIVTTPVAPADHGTPNTSPFVNG